MRFAPAPAEELLVLLRKRFDASTDQLEEAIRRIDTSPPTPDAFSVRGYQRVLEEAERLIRGAQQRVVVSGWPREIDQLSAEMKRAVKRRVYLVVFSHAALPSIHSGLVFEDPSEIRPKVRASLASNHDRVRRER